MTFIIVVVMYVVGGLSSSRVGKLGIPQLELHNNIILTTDCVCAFYDTKKWLGNVRPVMHLTRRTLPPALGINRGWLVR